MVAFLGFFQLIEIIFQLVFALPRRAIHTLQHFILFIAAPICARDAHQLKRILLDLFCRLHMRTTAQVYKRILLIDGYLRLLFKRIAILIESAFFEAIDQFQLIGLVCKNLTRLLRRNDSLLKLMFALHDSTHPLFDQFQIFRREISWQVKVIIETIFHWRPDRDLSIREHLHDCLRHDMRRRVADFIQLRIFVAFCDLCHFSFPFLHFDFASRSTPLGLCERLVCFCFVDMVASQRAAVIPIRARTNLRGAFE